MPSWIVSLPDRLDSFLAKEDRTLSRVRAQTAIEQGTVCVNDEVVTKSAYRLQEGDVVALSDTADSGHRTADSLTEPVDMRLSILYEDDSCLVIDKPASIAVHPGAGMAPDEKTLLNGIAWLFQDRSIPLRADAVLVHRLDRETTGCILTAKTPDAHGKLQKQFEERTVRKLYLAIVAGVPSPIEAVIDAPIGRSTANRVKMAVVGSSATREARTTYRVLDTARNAALLLCEIHTGRTHQIRLHLSAIGHPILGDGTYHSELSDRISGEFGITSLCLHAWKLTIRSPADGKEHEIVAPISRTMHEALQQLGLKFPLPKGEDAGEG